LSFDGSSSIPRQTTPEYNGSFPRAERKSRKYLKYGRIKFRSAFLFENYSKSKKIKKKIKISIEMK
jgi:hypothetical protein